jgi:hypothetical protein
MGFFRDGRALFNQGKTVIYGQGQRADIQLQITIIWGFDPFNE